jgi:hypothetical protein
MYILTSTVHDDGLGIKHLVRSAARPGPDRLLLGYRKADSPPVVVRRIVPKEPTAVPVLASVKETP